MTAEVANPFGYARLASAAAGRSVGCWRWPRSAGGIVNGTTGKGGGGRLQGRAGQRCPALSTYSDLFKGNS